MPQVSEITVKDAAGTDRDVATLTAIAALLGEVQASPTSNTVLERLKALLTSITALEASLEALSPSLTARLLSSAASTNSTSVKGSAGRVFSIQGYNAAEAITYLKLYNKATAPTIGTDTPVKTIALPPSTGFALDWPYGYEFTTGIGFGLTAAGGGADNSTSAVAAGDVLGLNIDYR